MKIIFLDALLIQSETDVNLNRFFVSREGFYAAGSLTEKGFAVAGLIMREVEE